MWFFLRNYVTIQTDFSFQNSQRGTDGMNIMFFLTPKSQVEYVIADYTIRQTAEKLSYHHYTAIPILSKEGKYIGTVSDGDLFWYVKEHTGMNYEEAEKTSILSVRRNRDIQAIKYDARMEDLLELALRENFIPVLDDREEFIGIVTRQKILNYFIESGKAKE